MSVARVGMHECECRVQVGAVPNCLDETGGVTIPCPDGLDEKEEPTLVSR